MSATAPASEFLSISGSASEARYMRSDGRTYLPSQNPASSYIRRKVRENSAAFSFSLSKRASISVRYSSMT